MQYKLKYVVPILLFIVGVSVMGINAYFYAKNEHAQRVELSLERTSIIGNRITNEIEHKQLYGSESFAELTRMFSKYALEYLNIAKLYNENSKLIFTSTPSKYYEKNVYINESIIKKVLLNRESYIKYSNEYMQVNAVFPLAMPLKKGEIYSKSYGVLYLQFDMSTQHKKLMQNIYKYTMINGLVILLMVIVLGALIYILILRRLNNLHEMTMAISKGNYDVRVETSFNDEFGEVNKAFNDMVTQISKHNRELENKVDEAVDKNEKQSRLMMQQNRLIAMGEMINNIAHQWRQPLNSLALILQKFELLQEKGLLTEEKVSSTVEKGMFQIEKMSSTIDDFRNFFKKDKEKQVFYIKELIEEANIFMENSLSEFNIELISKIEPSTEISGYKNELMQVIINLVNNAKDALVENREKDRRISINCHVENENMMMEIADNAGGVPSDVIDKVFDPYFTTKEEGKGTGIGLYMSKTIIEDNMGGRLSVSNSKDGAVFRIVLSLDNAHPFCEIFCEVKEKGKLCK